MVKEPEKYYEKLTEQTIRIIKGFDLLFDGVACPNEWLSNKGRFKRDLFDELDCCIRPRTDDEIVDMETFKTNLINSIERIRNATYYDYRYKDNQFQLANELVMYAHKFGIDIDRLERNHR